MDDFELLQSFVKTRSDAVFDELMRRHVDLVYTAARRRTADAHLAEDVTQAVFIVLARKAASLRSSVILPAWLLNVTRLTASNAVRQRKNQLRIERKAASMTTERTTQPASGEVGESASEAARVAPLLDDAIASLAESDRNALVLRYFSRCSLAEVGQRLGVTPAAAEKRVSRAAERLRQSLVRGGVVLSLIGLAQVLTDSSVSAAPAEIAGKLSGAIATDAAGIQITPSVELANHTMQALKGSAIKPLLTGTAALVAASFIGGVLLTYFVLTRPAASTVANSRPVEIPPAPAAVAPAPLKEDPIELPPAGGVAVPDTARNNPIQNARAPFAPPDQLVPAQGARIDLLARVDISADNLNGEWTQAPGVLQSGAYAYSLVQLPYSAPEEYDFHASFKVLDPRGEVMMLCAHKGADFGWRMGANENHADLFDITPLYSQKNSSRREFDAVFAAGGHYDVTVQVRNNGLAAYINGKLISQLETDYRNFSNFEYWQLQNRTALGVGTWGTPTRFESLEVVEVSGHGTWLRTEGQPVVARARAVLTPAADWSKAVDLMPLIDPERDAVSGTWVRNNDGALVSDKGSLARLEIPYKPPEEYDYKMVFTRNTGWDTIAQCFGQNRSSLFWGMAMWGNELNMFRCVSAFDGTNPTTVWAKDFIENGRRYESIVQVRKQGYAAFIDGKLISFWERGYKGSHSSKEWRLPTPGALGIGSSNSQTTFHSLQVLEITGTGSAIPTTAPKRIEAPPGPAQPEAPKAPSVVKPPKPPPDAF
ncbi:MAG TPA: sigma-70 family RNA polymerase sigma factor [Planctomycetota bacterium]|nr:sigma-70 family RNA polymerase sigma factor [Planctomycetota bacterium]